MSRLRAAVVGATGMAGQQFVQALSRHPNFEVVLMVTSRTRNTYKEASLESNGRWIQDSPVPDDMADVPVVSSKEFHPDAVDVIFTATSMGRLEEETVLGGVKYVLVSHNTKMGAGKGAVLLAESMLARGLLHG